MCFCFSQRRQQLFLRDLMRVTTQKSWFEIWINNSILTNLELKCAVWRRSNSLQVLVADNLENEHWRNCLDLFQGDFYLRTKRQSRGRCCMFVFFPSCFQYLAISCLPPTRKIQRITSLRDYPKLSFGILWGHASFEQCLKPFAAHILNGWFGRDLILERILLWISDILLMEEIRHHLGCLKPCI